MKLSEIASKLDGVTLRGNSSHDVTHITSPDKANSSSICVIWDKSALTSIPPDATLITRPDDFPSGHDGMTCDNPRAILPQLTAIFTPQTPHQKGIHPLSHVSPSAKIHPDAYIAPFAYVGDDCVVGAGTVIEPQAVLLLRVSVGENCLIHSGAVIGADGFGFERTSSGLVKIPQMGGVKIGDNVEIGACTTIDRATMGDTVIGSGTKIDNQVQIGHNVKMGKNCIICSMSGIGGSSELGDNVTLSIQAGITDHAKIGDNVIIAGRSGVTNDVPSNSIVSGFPARPHNEAKRALVLAADLPSLYKRIRILERKLGAMPE